MSDDRTVLLVEDDQTLAREIIPVFEEMNLRVEHVADGAQGLERGLARDYTMVILDVVLPGMNGLDVCRKLRGAKPRLPIMMLTTRGNEVDKVLGLELGADDYMVKPFSSTELVARVRAKLRQVEAYRQGSVPPAMKTDAPDGSVIVIQGLALDPVRRTLTKDGESVELTRKEFDLLLLLMRAPGRVYSKREILLAVWEVDYPGYEDSVVSMVRRVRSKIGDDRDEPRYIRTVHGLGYSFLEDGAESSSA